MLKYINVDVRISELHTQPLCVPAWELPILRVIHGDGVQPRDETLVDREPPPAEDEFRRLVTRYRNSRTDDGSIGIPNVASVYGQFGVGTENLRRAIAEATVHSSYDDLLGELAVSSVGG